MNLGERIALAIKESGKRQKTIADEIRISPGALTLWKNGTTKSIEGSNLIRAAKALGVRAEWLATGKGDMRDSDLGPAITTPLRPIQLIGEHDNLSDEIISVPRYTVRASAGHGAPVLEVDTEGQPNYCRAQWAQRNGYKPNLLFSVVATGDSMEPTIPHGASLIVHRQENVVNGRIHIICRGDECYVKRLFKQMDGSVLVRSDNRDAYADITVTQSDPQELHIVGLVVSYSANV